MPDLNFWVFLVGGQFLNLELRASETCGGLYFRFLFILPIAELLQLNCISISGLLMIPFKY